MALLLGVTFHRELFFQSIQPRLDGSWHARLSNALDQSESSLLEDQSWDSIVDATGGSANTASTISPDLSRKEFRGLLAIGITVKVAHFAFFFNRFCDNMKTIQNSNGTYILDL